MPLKSLKVVASFCLTFVKEAPAETSPLHGRKDSSSCCSDRWTNGHGPQPQFACHDSRKCSSCAEHLLSLRLPDSIMENAGRLVAYHESNKGPSNKTSLDVSSKEHNEVLRKKKVLIGCGGGFQHGHQKKSLPLPDCPGNV